MQTAQIYKRLTYGYADGWSYLDKDRFITTVKLTPAKKVWESKKDNSFRYVQHCRAPAGTNLNTLAAAIEDTISGCDCKQEHDCCGCQIRYTTVKHLGNRRLLIKTDVRYNY